jgi:hypothetical protein
MLSSLSDHGERVSDPVVKVAPGEAEMYVCVQGGPELGRVRWVRGECRRLRSPVREGARS